MRVFAFLFVILLFAACHKDKNDDSIDTNHITRINAGSATKLIKDNRGGFIIAGKVNVFNSTQSQLIKIDSLGYKYWGTNFGDNNVDGINDVLRTNTGFLTAGYTTTEEKSDTTFAISCLDNAGSIFWQHRYGIGSANVIIDAYDQNYYGEYLVGGKSIMKDENSAQVSENLSVIKINNKGSILWQYSLSNSTGVQDILRNENSFFITGNSKTKSEIANSSNVLVAALNVDGTEQWKKEIKLKDLPDGMTATGIKLLKLTDGFLLAAAATSSNNKAIKEAYLLKLSYNGEVIWEKNMSSNFELTDAKKANGHIYLLGNTFNSATNLYETNLIEADIRGTIINQYSFVINYDGVDDNSTSMYFDNDFVYIVGNSVVYRGSSSNRMYYFKYPITEFNSLTKK